MIEPAGDGPTVVLHIGEPKTGTTHFQEIAWCNRTLLAASGVQLAGHSISDQFRAMQDLRGIPPEPDDPSGSWVGEWDVLAAQARSARRLALISQESIAAADGDRVEHAVCSLGPDVHVVLTVRDFASLLPAEWQETVKHRRTRSWPEWLEHVVSTEPEIGARPAWGFWRVHDTPEVLRTWLRFVPAHRIHLVTMPRRSSDPAVLWRRLSGLLGIGDLAVDTDVRRNPSLGMAETEFLRSLNPELAGRVPNWFYAAEVKQALAHGALANRPNTDRPLLPADVEAWAWRRSELTIEFVRGAGVDVIGDLDELRPMPREVTSQASSVSTANQLDVAVHALAAQVERAHAGRTHVARSADRSPTGIAMEIVGASPRLKRAARRLAGRPGGGWARVAAWRAHEAVSARHARTATTQVRSTSD